MVDIIEVRPFIAADAPAVSAVIAATMRRSNAPDYPADLLESLISYFSAEKLCALAGERAIWVATSAGAIIGTAGRDGDELVTFFVDPGWQGRGVGSRLLAAIEREAATSGRRRLRVASSITAVGFYERHEYQPNGPPIVGTAGPQVVLTKSLSDALANER